jgi:hypothetical protein
MSPPGASFARRGFGLSWFLSCAAFAFHVWDLWEHDFLSYYNATVLTLYGHFCWFPRIDITYRGWLLGMVLPIALCMALTPYAFRNANWLRPLAYLFALVQFLNAIGIAISELRGSTVPSVRFEGIAPGLYTAPLLLATSTYLFWRLRRTKSPKPAR